MLIQCWANVLDGRQTLNRRLVLAGNRLVISQETQHNKLLQVNVGPELQTVNQR